MRRGAFEDTRFDQLPFAVPTAPVRHLAGNIFGVDCWPYESVPRLVKYRLTSLESALELTRRGRCAVFVPEFLVGLHNQTVRADRKLVRFSSPPRMRPVRPAVNVLSRADADEIDMTSALGKALAAIVAEGTHRVGKPS